MFFVYYSKNKMNFRNYMDKITKIISKCIQDLQNEGIFASLVRMYGSDDIEAIITLPNYKLLDNTVSNKEEEEKDNHEQ